MNIREKMVSCILLTALAAGCLCGCGGEFTDGTGKPGGVVSGGAVSGEAVSGGAVSDELVSEETVSGGAVKQEAGEDVQARGRQELFCSGNCGYFFRDDPKELVQISLRDGKEKDYKVKNMSELIYIGEDELIYWGKTEEYKETFYMIPIVSKADGTEELKTAAAKQVSGVPSDLDYLGAAYADGQYFIYCRAEEVEVRCYNRKTGQTSEMPMQGKIKELVADVIQCTKRIGECLYLYTMNGDILCWQMDENKVYYYADDEWYQDVQAYTKDGVFGIDNESDQNAIMIDAVSQKKTTVISKDEVDRLLEQEFGDVRYWSMGDLFLDGGRVYAQLRVEWVENKTCYAQSVVLGREIDGSGEIKYERKLTEEIMAAERRVMGREKALPLKEADDELYTEVTSGIEKVQHYDGYCMIFDGKAYLVVGDEDKVGACYDLKSGACKAVNKRDPEYYVMDILAGRTED